MLNIYKLADKKFLKYTDPDCRFSYYVNVDDISRFQERYETDPGEPYLSIWTKNGDYCPTSYKFSDLEDSL
jgi:hypothetical protein